MFLSFIHAVVHIRASFLPVAEYFTVWDGPHSFHQLMDILVVCTSGYWEWFCYAHMFQFLFQHLFSAILGTHPGMELMGHMEILWLTN